MMYEKFGWKTFWIALACIACTALLMWGIVAIIQSNNQPETIRAKAEVKQTKPTIVKRIVELEKPVASERAKGMEAVVENNRKIILGGDAALWVLTIWIVLIVLIILYLVKERGY